MNEELKTNLTLPQMLRNLIFIAQGSRVAWVPNFKYGSIQQLRRQTYTLKDLQAYFKSDSNASTHFEFWLKHPERLSSPTVQDAWFMANRLSFERWEQQSQAQQREGQNLAP